MRRLPILIGGATVLSGLSGVGAAAWAAPRLRVQVDQHGDFLLIGNTLGYECTGDSQIVEGVVTSGSCNQGTVYKEDSAPDLFWRADAIDAGTAVADILFGPNDARTTAVLTVPADATITHAYLYWAAKAGGSTGTEVTVARPGTGGFEKKFTAEASYPPSGGAVYQSVADLTSLVRQYGTGAYRVSGITVSPFANTADNDLFGAWALVAFYERSSDPIRNLAIFEGMDEVGNGSNQSVLLSGFVVPTTAEYSGKLGVVAYEGDADSPGDKLFFNGGAALSDDQNPENNFFNATRSWLGSAVNFPGDQPRMTGKFSSMAGVDLDVVDIKSHLTPGLTQAPVEATSIGDAYYLGAFITSITTIKPDFTTSTKTVARVATAADAGSVDAGSVVWGDELEYTVTVVNSGNDASAKTVLADDLPAQVTYVPGSLRVGTGAGGTTVLTDATGDDQGDYISGPSPRIVVRIGAGADSTHGGSLAANGGSAIVTFRVRVNAGAIGKISNQAFITASGALGAAQTTTPTDGNGAGQGAPPTDIGVNQCDSKADCSAPTPVCDTSASPRVCVGCLEDTDCGAASGTVCTANRTCVPGCHPVDGGDRCPQGQTCHFTDGSDLGQCVPDQSASSDAGDAGTGNLGDAADGGILDAASGPDEAGDGAARDELADVALDRSSSAVPVDAGNDSGTGGDASTSDRPISSGIGGIDTSGVVAQGNGIACDCRVPSRSGHPRGGAALVSLALGALAALFRRRSRGG